MVRGHDEVNQITSMRKGSLGNLGGRLRRPRCYRRRWSACCYRFALQEEWPWWCRTGAYLSRATTRDTSSNEISRVRRRWNHASGGENEGWRRVQQAARFCRFI